MRLMQARHGNMKCIIEKHLDDLTLVRYAMSTRFTIGLRTLLMEATHGTAIIEVVPDCYQPATTLSLKKERGSLLAGTSGNISSRGVSKAQEHGPTFVAPGTPVYKDMIVGYSSTKHDIRMNVCKEKHMSNMRASGKDRSDSVSPPIEITIDSGFEYITSADILEVTPSNVRMAKRTAMIRK
eukprot:GHVS01103543.1.p1 GENE.GHVS01103543.1~~GHVS01103543.1.p1  ORF type:complete len:182 (-),score=11.53 GHVS01103543.1:13-558(-)